MRTLIHTKHDDIREANDIHEALEWAVANGMTSDGFVPWTLVQEHFGRAWTKPEMEQAIQIWVRMSDAEKGIPSTRDVVSEALDDLIAETNEYRADLRQYDEEVEDFEVTPEYRAQLIAAVEAADALLPKSLQDNCVLRGPMANRLARAYGLRDWEALGNVAPRALPQAAQGGRPPRPRRSRPRPRWHPPCHRRAEAPAAAPARGTLGGAYRGADRRRPAGRAGRRAPAASDR